MVTIKSLLEKAIRGVIAQGKASTDAAGGCAYRGEGGTKCAIGMLISDEWYDDGLEGNSATEEMVIKAVEQSQRLSVGNRGVSYLHRVQVCHDHADAEASGFVVEFQNWIRDSVDRKKLPLYCLDFLEEK